jgi:hypothetical protein
MLPHVQINQSIELKYDDFMISVAIWYDKSVVENARSMLLTNHKSTHDTK